MATPLGYQKKPTSRPALRQCEVRLSRRSIIANCVDPANRLLNSEENGEMVIITACGPAIRNAIALCEIVKRQNNLIHQITDIDTIVITDEWLPMEEFDSDAIVRKRNVSYISITLTKAVPDKIDVPGYQAPLEDAQSRTGSPRPGTPPRPAAPEAFPSPFPAARAATIPILNDSVQWNSYTAALLRMMAAGGGPGGPSYAPTSQLGSRPEDGEHALSDDWLTRKGLLGARASSFQGLLSEKTPPSRPTFPHLQQSAATSFLTQPLIDSLLPPDFYSEPRSELYHEWTSERDEAANRFGSSWADWIDLARAVYNHSAPSAGLHPHREVPICWPRWACT